MNKQLLLGGNDRAETDEPATVDADRPVTCDADKPLRLIDWFWSYSYYYYYYLTARLDCGVLLSQEPFDDTSSVKSSSSSHFSHIYYWTTASTRAAWPPSKYPRELADRLFNKLRWAAGGPNSSRCNPDADWLVTGTEVSQAGQPVAPLLGGTEWATKTVFSRRVTEAEPRDGEPSHHYMGGPHLVYISAQHRGYQLLIIGGQVAYIYKTCDWGREGLN